MLELTCDFCKTYRNQCKLSINKDVAKTCTNFNFDSNLAAGFLLNLLIQENYHINNEWFTTKDILNNILNNIKPFDIKEKKFDVYYPLYRLIKEKILERTENTKPVRFRFIKNSTDFLFKSHKNILLISCKNCIDSCKQEDTICEKFSYGIGEKEKVILNAFKITGEKEKVHFFINYHLFNVPFIKRPSADEVSEFLNSRSFEDCIENKSVELGDVEIFIQKGLEQYHVIKNLIEENEKLKQQLESYKKNVTLSEEILSEKEELQKELRNLTEINTALQRDDVNKYERLINRNNELENQLKYFESVDIKLKNLEKIKRENQETISLLHKQKKELQNRILELENSPKNQAFLKEKASLEKKIRELEEIVQNPPKRVAVQLHAIQQEYNKNMKGNTRERAFH